MSGMKVKSSSQAPVEKARGTPNKVEKKTAGQLWWQRFAQLDMERDCTASSGDSCWLCNCLGQWNAVLNPLWIDLLETEPGKITAFTGERKKGPTPLKKELAAHHAALFVVWLQQKHCCVDGVTFRDNHPVMNGDAIPHLVAGSHSNVRHIKICGGSFPAWRLDVDVVGPVGQLESLVLAQVRTDDDMGRKLARLVEANASSLRAVKFTDVCATSFASDVLVSALSKCKRVKDLEYGPILSQSGLAEFANVLRNAESLQSLTLVTPFSTYDSTHTDITVYRRTLLAAVGDLVKCSMTLEELVYRGEDHEFQGILEALGANNTVRVLVLGGCPKGRVNMDISVRTATVLQSVLLKNKRLESLTFEKCAINDVCGVLILAGLVKNRTLKCLDTSDCELTCLAACALCYALGLNMTASLKIGCFSATRSERKELAELLARMDSYNRVQMFWHNCDAPGLAASLQASSCPRELRLSTSQLSEAPFRSLCKALSSSCRVVSLAVELANCSFRQVDSLSQMLAKNTSLRDVTLRDRYYFMADAVEAAQGLCSNKFVMRLSVNCNWVEIEAAQLLASLLKQNEALNEVFLSTCNSLGRRSMKKVSQGMVRNRFITNFTISAGPNTKGSMAALYGAVERNRTGLHRAARFVLGRNTGKLCAEGFELFAEKESLIACIVATSELTEADAVAAVERAKRFILNNYLVINEVYRDKLECNPGEGTQIDDLNFECWLAIVKYLKVSDIVGV